MAPGLANLPRLPSSETDYYTVASLLLLLRALSIPDYLLVSALRRSLLRLPAAEVVLDFGTCLVLQATPTFTIFWHF